MRKVLVIDDEIDKVRGVLEEILDGCEIVYAADGAEGLATLTDDVGVVLLDIIMPPKVGKEREREGLAVMAEIARRRPGLPVIMFTNHAEVGLALEAGRLGAFEYVVKNQLDHLAGLVEKALAASSAGANQSTARSSLGALVGSSERMRKLYSDIERVAATNADVLILGPTGSGKDLIAREIHRAGRRASGPFRPVNVGAIPTGLFESVLFGHKKGSFTGANADKEGEFELAGGGTLFLDEIGTLVPEAQVKLLRAVEDKKITRVGETAPRAVDTRIIAATNANLLKAVHDGDFREDLYYRLRGVTVMAPPLADHREDIPELAKRLLARVIVDEDMPARKLSEEAIAFLSGRDWPGNVRSLQNALRNAVIFAAGQEIKPDDFDLDDDAESVTVHDLDKLYTDQKAGRAGAATPRDFKAKYGEAALKRCLERAIEETHDQAQAGVILGFLGEDYTPEQYNTFRQWFRRIGLTSKGVLRDK